jgi:hypothetical protein
MFTGGVNFSNDGIVLWRYASLCRMANVMRPYMESLS